MFNLDASLLQKFVQFVHFAGIEVDGRNWDRNWVTGNGIEVGLQELRSKLLTGIEMEVGLGIGVGLATSKLDYRK